MTTGFATVSSCCAPKACGSIVCRENNGATAGKLAHRDTGTVWSQNVRVHQVWVYKGIGEAIGDLTSFMQLWSVVNRNDVARPWLAKGLLYEDHLEIYVIPSKCKANSHSFYLETRLQRTDFEARRMLVVATRSQLTVSYPSHYSTVDPGKVIAVSDAQVGEIISISSFSCRP